MEQPPLNRNHRPAAPRAFIESLKGIPEASDWKSRLRNIPKEAYLESETRPVASEALKERLKRIPSKPRVLPMVWRVAAAAAGLGLLSLMWWPDAPLNERAPLPQVERLTPTAPLPLPVENPVHQALQATNGLRAERHSAAQERLPETQHEALAATTIPSLKPMTALRATALAVPAWESDLALAEEALAWEEGKAHHPEPPSLRARFAKTGEQLLIRSGGKWGWSIAPENDAVKFRVYANKNQWVALRRSGPR